MKGPHTVRTDQITTDQITINRRQRLIFVHGNRIDITPAEWEVLEVLLRQPGQPFAINRLVTEVPREGSILSEATVRSHIHNLQRKLNQHHLMVIENRHGHGYRICPEAIEYSTE